MKLSDFKGEEALDVLADIIEPLSSILGDEEMREVAKDGAEKGKKVPPIVYIKIALKKHKKEVIEVLARLENKPVQEYKKEVNLMTLPMALLSLVNDPEIQNLFTLQGQTEITQLASSGPAMENTEANAK